MTKFRQNRIGLFVLITAFLTTQWGTAHIHLAEHHDHNGSHHEHNIEVHAHHSIDHHADALDFAHQTSDINVVELEHEFSTATVNKHKKPPTTAMTSVLQTLSLSQAISIEPSPVVNTRLNHLYLAINHPRAPPRFS